MREDPTISGYDRPYYRTHGSSAYETVDPSTLVSVNAAVDCVCVCVLLVLLVLPVLLSYLGPSGAVHWHEILLSLSRRTPPDYTCRDSLAA